MHRAIHFFSIGILLFVSLGAHAETRVALIIGNGAYVNAIQLPNPKNDAEDVAAALNRMGFETVVGFDLDKAGMEEKTIEFARAAKRADVALFYYSGHAMQFGGVNYLMPVDAKLNDEADLRRLARLDEVVGDLQQAKSLRILVLDSCRDNPLAEELKRSIGNTRAASIQRGLAKIDTPQGMIVSFSTQAQQVAEDGSGRNSPYTTAFLKHIEADGEIGSVFRRITADVYETTSHKQLPELSLSMIGEYYLRGAPVMQNAQPAQSTVAVPPPSTDPAAEAWRAVKDTESDAMLETFIAKFTPSFYADLARARLDERKREEADAEERKREEHAATEKANAEVRRLEEERLARLKPADPPAVVVPQGGAGDWLVILGSWSKSERRKAGQRLSYLQGHGVDARIIDTNDYPNLKDGLLAVVLGPYSKPVAEQTLNSLRGVVGDAYIKSGY